MNPETSPPEGPQGPPSEAAPAAPTLGEALSSIWQATLVRYAARVELISLDVRRAGLSLGHVIIVSLLCAFMLWTAWFTSMAALVWLVGHLAGSYVWGLLLVVALNLLLMGWLWQQVIRLTHHLTLPAVRAHILGARHE